MGKGERVFDSENIGERAWSGSVSLGVKLFHRTTAANAKEIIRGGFRDSTNHEGKTGVWFATPALGAMINANSSSENDTLISIEVPDEVARQHDDTWEPEIPEALKARFSVDKMGVSSREYCLPAALANTFDRKIASNNEEPS